MIKRVLIANRGEIACRIIKTAKQMAIETVAVYSDADRNSLHVKLADHAEYIGPSPAIESYLVVDNIVRVAKKWQVDAIHPGYGFLSENPSLAQACCDNNIRFIGPSVDAIKQMGSKSQAKAIMSKANVPLVPGYHGKDNSKTTLISEADKIGYPVMLKATLGGGGKGMRVVNTSSDMPSAIDAVQREALSCFGNGDMLIEKCITKPRHVEVQVFADVDGHCLYLSDRDCSIQRRHQKVIEEAPAPGLSDELRYQMGQAAVQAAKAINYVGAGTVEFLLDEGGEFYFMEMNTRLQVEHPVTEMITGIDLVEWQFNVASGLPLPITQQMVNHHGHAIELRIYAEDTDNDFMPSTGKISLLNQPNITDCIRVDSGVIQGDLVSEYYDPMLSKLIVWGESRDAAIQQLKQAICRYHIQGITTNTGYLHSLISLAAFSNAELDTDFLTTHQSAVQQQHTIEPEIWLALGATARWLSISTGRDNNLPSPLTHGFRLSPLNQWRFNFSHQNNNHQVLLFAEDKGTEGTLTLQIGDNHYSVVIIDQRDQIVIEVNEVRYRFEVAVNPQSTTVFLYGQQRQFDHLARFESNKNEDNEFQPIAPLNGLVSAILINQSDYVEAGQPLMVIEAMKMEYTITASQNAVVDDILFQIGDQVHHGAILLALSPSEQPAVSQIEA